MRLTQLRLTNISCFSDLVLEFTDEAENPCPWVIVLGENGSGKSTALRMLGLALLGRDLVHEVARSEDWGKYVRTGQPKGRLIATMLPAKKEVPAKSERRSAVDRSTRAVFDVAPKHSFGIRQDVQSTSADMRLLDSTLHSERLDVGWFACGYGPHRRILPTPFGTHPLSAAAGKGKAYRFATLYDDALALTRVSDWLVELDFRSMKEGGSGPAKQHLRVAIEALERVLPEATYKGITADGEVRFEERGASVSLDRLSDGYRSVGGLVGDLVRRLTDAFPKAKNPLGEEGVVLIDELDLHLHPAWQATVVEELRSLFPKMQFIVTSHSPFVAQDARPQDKIIVLRRDAGGVTEDSSPGLVTGWRADQILTSRLFGLPRTRDAGLTEVRGSLKRARDQVQGDLTPDETERLDEARSWLNQQVTGPGEHLDTRELFQVANRFSELMAEVLERGVET